MGGFSLGVSLPPSQKAVFEVSASLREFACRTSPARLQPFEYVFD